MSENVSVGRCGEGTTVRREGRWLGVDHVSEVISTVVWKDALDTVRQRSKYLIRSIIALVHIWRISPRKEKLAVTASRLFSSRSLHFIHSIHIHVHL